MYYVLELLSETGSTNEKKEIIADIPEQLKEDFELCVQALTGQIKFGYTYRVVDSSNTITLRDDLTIKDLFTILQRPSIIKRLKQQYDRALYSTYYALGLFL